MRKFIVIFLLALSSCCSESKSWEDVLDDNIKLLGHRNWIVIADSAYPLQSNPGITTIVSDDDHLKTIKKVTKLIGEQSHIKANVYLDKELDYMVEEDAEGIDKFRESLSELLASSSPQKLIHEDIITKLDEASELFNVIIIKTDFDLQYTTVFYNLDCGYWNSEAEQRLRKSMKTQN